MAKRTLFDGIIDGTIPSWKVWEDDTYLAFLTPFGNTPGATVVVPKANPGDYVFALKSDVVSGLMVAAKHTANILEKALGVSRVAAVFEGEAVPHLHIKLYPMHALDADRSQFPKQTAFFPIYPGYISTAEGPRQTDEALQEMYDRIQKVTNNEN